MAAAKTKGGGRDATSGKGRQAESCLDTEIDPIIQLPLPYSTAPRNALARRLKKACQAANPERVRALPKPSVPAWTVNQVYWTRREAYERLILTGERFRTAQAAQLAGR